MSRINPSGYGDGSRGAGLLQLAETFDNEPVIDRPQFTVLGDALVGIAVIPILCGFHVRDFRNDDSLKTGASAIHAA